MPNWCNNSIRIIGDYDTLVQLKPVVDSGEGFLQAIKPMPKELGETVKGSGDELQTTAYDGHTNWYDWAVANWGTKWDPEVHLEFQDNGDGTATITGWFDTAWSPPLEALHSLSQDWDSCYIELFYHESGMCFIGCWDSEGADDYYEYSDCSSENVRGTIPEYLVDEFALDEQLAEYEEEESADA